MLTTAKRLSIAAATFACALGASAPANAILVVGFCSGPVCLGFNDIIVQDNMAGDTNATLGAISFETSAFGYDLLVNAAQSKPVLGSADSPKLGLTFSATNLGVAGAHSLLASDTDFTAGGGTFGFTFSGTNSSGFPVSGFSGGGTSNTAPRSPPSPLLAMINSSDPAFSGSASGAFTPSANPYSLTIGALIVHSVSPFTTTLTGDLSLQIAPIPEPSTWALMLVGPALIGFVARSRRVGR